MKKIALFLVGLAAYAAAAAPVSPGRAARVAQAFIGGQAKGVVPTQVKHGWDYSGIYLFDLDGKGFVLVAADDVALPVLGYSTSRSLPVGSLPVQLVELLDSYQAQITWATQTGIHSDPGWQPNSQLSTLNSQLSILNSQLSISRLWHQLESGQVRPASKEAVVEPLLATHWDQSTPYNNLCPTGCVTGCAATAQAQVMKYWNHPKFGRGSHAYSLANYGRQQAVFGKTLYDWNYMPDRVTRSSTARQQQAVATLMYHVGVSLEMSYNTPLDGGSAAIGLVGEPGYASIDNSLKDYFYYSPAMRVVHKDQGYSDSAWAEMLKADLRQGHPIIYSGISEQGGHGFVCDGYDADGLFHFNFGWSGDGDGYYAIGAIVVPRGPNGEYGSYDFSGHNQALLGLEPTYAILLNDSVKAFARQGGCDTVFVSPNPVVESPIRVEYDADWLTVDTIDSLGVVVLLLQASANDAGAQRECVVTIAQGSATASLRVVQDCYGFEEYCPMTVVMTSRRSGGWPNNAHLTLQSEAGMVYGTAALTGSTLDSVTINVSPQKLYAVWHSGGGTDRYVGYTIKDAYGNVRAKVENAYHDTTDFVIPVPCHNLAIDEPAGVGHSITAYPNPARHVVDIVSEGVQIRRVVLVDPMGRTLLDSPTLRRIDLGGYAPGIYYLRFETTCGNVTQKLVKL